MNLIKKHPLATLIVAWVLILVVSIGIFAAKASATPGRWVVTTLSWGPYNCIRITGAAATVNDCHGGYDRSSPTFVPVGGMMGVDPDIGDNLWVNCSITDASTGELIFADGGTKGDGHDINCLRILNTATVSA